MSLEGISPSSESVALPFEKFHVSPSLSPSISSNSILTSLYPDTTSLHRNILGSKWRLARVGMEPSLTGWSNRWKRGVLQGVFIHEGTTNKEVIRCVEKNPLITLDGNCLPPNTLLTFIPRDRRTANTLPQFTSILFFTLNLSTATLQLLLTTRSHATFGYSNPSAMQSILNGFRLENKKEQIGKGNTFFFTLKTNDTLL